MGAVNVRKQRRPPLSARSALGHHVFEPRQERFRPGAPGERSHFRPTHHETSPTQRPPTCPRKEREPVVVTINGGGDLDRPWWRDQPDQHHGRRHDSQHPPRPEHGERTVRHTGRKAGVAARSHSSSTSRTGPVGDISHVEELVTTFISDACRHARAGSGRALPNHREHPRRRRGVVEVLRHDQWTPRSRHSLLAVPDLKGHGRPEGGTNWEDAILPHVTRPTTPSAAPLPITPKTVVFFTDGVPTWDRIHQARYARRAHLPPHRWPDPGLPCANGKGRIARWRSTGSNFWANIWRAADDTKLIGVGVGDGHRRLVELGCPVPGAGYRPGLAGANDLHPPDELVRTNRTGSTSSS